MKKIICVILSIISVLFVFSISTFAVTEWEIANGETGVVQTGEPEEVPDTGASNDDVTWAVRTIVTDDMDYCCITYKITIVDTTNKTSFVKEVKWNNKNLDKKTYTLVDSKEYPGHETDYKPVKVIMYADEYYKADRDLTMELYILESKDTKKELDIIYESNSDCDFDTDIGWGSTSVNIHWDTDMFAQNKFYLEVGTDCMGNGYHWWSRYYTTQNYTCTLPELSRRVCLFCGRMETNVQTDTAHHDHRLVEQKSRTCTEDGYEKWQCTVCGDVLLIENKTSGHYLYNEKIYYEPTCQFTPGKWGKCSVCEKYIKDETFHLDNEDEEIVPCEMAMTIFRKYTPATCTENAKVTDECKWCGKKMTEEYEGTAGHKNFATRWKDGIAPTCSTGATLEIYCVDCGYIKSSTEVDNHNYSEWTVKKTATCYSNEIQQRVCPDCGHTEEKEIENTIVRHKYENIVYKKPTCTEDGCYELHCIYCNKLYSENTIRPKTGHSFTIVGRVEPTCESAGVITRKCSTCGTIEEETLNALGHDYVETRIEPTAKCVGYIIKTCVRCRISDVEVIEVAVEEPSTEEETTDEPSTEEETTTPDETTSEEETTEKNVDDTTHKCSVWEWFINLIRTIVNKIKRVIK